MQIRFIVPGKLHCKEYHANEVSVLYVQRTSNVHIVFTVEEHVES